MLWKGVQASEIIEGIGNNSHAGVEIDRVRDCGAVITSDQCPIAIKLQIVCPIGVVKEVGLEVVLCPHQIFIAEQARNSADGEFFRLDILSPSAPAPWSPLPDCRNPTSPGTSLPPTSLAASLFKRPSSVPPRQPWVTRHLSIPYYRRNAPVPNTCTMLYSCRVRPDGNGCRSLCIIIHHLMNHSLKMRIRHAQPPTNVT